MTIADTDVLIDYLMGEGSAGQVEKLIGHGLQTTVVSRFELLSGARTPKQIARVKELLDAVPSLPLDSASADAASEVRRELERAGLGVGMADSLIAGIVRTRGASLLTRNRRHFERIRGMKLV
jgi:tRNA(fMet)-specific endonuclease VapC